MLDGLQRKFIEKNWYTSSLTLSAICLLPFSYLFRLIVSLRRYFYQRIFSRESFSVPIIVVGNITVGGTGKTPFVIALAELLKKKGWKPGIVTRGVGGRKQVLPKKIDETSSPNTVGDEAILLSKKTNCPVVVGLNRVEAVKKLLADTECNIVISDDGLQHYRLSRDVEIVMMDGERGLGNQQCLPAGPLREPVSRLKDVNFVVVNQKENTTANHFPFPFLSVAFQGNHAVSIKNPNLKKSLDDFKNQKVHAVAAIGNPERFFATLRNKNIKLIEHVFPDHYLYQVKDLSFNDNLPIIMTEKDAVKCESFADDRFWFVPIEAQLENLPPFIHRKPN